MALSYEDIKQICKIDQIEKLIKELEEQKDILEKFECYSDYDRGLFQGKLNMIEILLTNLKDMLK